MRSSKSNVDNLVRLREEVDAESRKVFNPDGGRNREALLRLSDLAYQMVRIYETESAEMCRLANRAYDLAMTK